MYVQFIGDQRNKHLTKGKNYEVLQIIENYYYLINDDENIESIHEPHLFKITSLLKVKYIGKDSFSLKKNKIYDVIAIESASSKNDTYRIIDETDEDYLFHRDSFEIIEDNLDSI